MKFKIQVHEEFACYYLLHLYNAGLLLEMQQAT